MSFCFLERAQGPLTSWYWEAGQEGQGNLAKWNYRRPWGHWSCTLRSGIWKPSVYECGGKRESREGGERERHPDLEIIMALISKTAISNPPMYMSKGKSHSSWFLVPALESPVGRHWASYYSLWVCTRFKGSGPTAKEITIWFLVLHDPGHIT